MLRVFVALICLVLAQGSDVQLDSCVNKPGQIYTACPETIPPVDSPETPRPTDILVDCCKTTTFSGRDGVRYEFARGKWELVILCAEIQRGDKIELKKVWCDDGSCKYIEIDETASFPMTIPMMGARWTFYGKKFNINFLAKNSRRNGCDCPDTCMPGWVKHGDYCYMLTSIQGNFDEMEEHCTSLRPGAHLASINSQDENDFIVEQFTTDEKKDFFWIGLYSPKERFGVRTWKWTDCSTNQFTNWEEEPDRMNGRKKYCARLKPSFHPQWNVVKCKKKYLGLCKYFNSNL